MFGRGQPLLDDRLIHFDRHAGVCFGADLFEILNRKVRHRDRVARQDRAKRLPRLPFRVLWRQLLHAIVGEFDLRVDRLLDPQRAVLVEHRNPQLQRHVLRSLLGRRRFRELDQGPLGRDNRSTTATDRSGPSRAPSAAKRYTASARSRFVRSGNMHRVQLACRFARKLAGTRADVAATFLFALGSPSGSAP